VRVLKLGQFLGQESQKFHEDAYNKLDSFILTIESIILPVMLLIVSGRSLNVKVHFLLNASDLSSYLKHYYQIQIVFVLHLNFNYLNVMHQQTRRNLKIYCLYY